MGLLCGEERVIEKLNDVIRYDYSSPAIRSIVTTIKEASHFICYNASDYSGGIYLKNEVDDFFANNVFVDNGIITIVSRNSDEKSANLYCISEDKNTGEAYITKYFLDRINTSRGEFYTYTAKYSDTYFKNMEKNNDIVYHGRCHSADLDNTNIKYWPILLDNEMFDDLRNGGCISCDRHGLVGLKLHDQQFVGGHIESVNGKNCISDRGLWNIDEESQARIINTLLRGGVTPENVQKRLGLLPENQPNFDTMDLY